MENARPPDWLPDAIGARYEVEREIGRGGMAVVFLARDRQLSRKVALKLLRPELSATLWRDRFLREIQIEAALQHPGILPIFESGEADGMLYYTMPFVEGLSLRDRLVREGPLPVDTALKIVSEVGGALAHAHKAGLVHRDIKPGNILMSDGHALVADFGIARAVTQAGGEALTRESFTFGTPTGIAVGTPEYMSPEQVAGDDTIDGRSDQYALACVLFELLAGDPPFTGRTSQSVVNRQLNEPPPSLRHRRAKTPLHIVGAVDKALSKVPADRYPSIDRFIAALHDTSAVPTPAPSAWRRVGLGVLALAAVALVVYLWLPPEVALDPVKVVVFPLAERGEVEARRGVGYDLALTIEAAVDQTEPLRWLDGFKRLAPEQRADPALVGPKEAGRISRAAGAASYIAGAVQFRGDSITVILELWSVAGDSMVTREPLTASLQQTDMHLLAIDAAKGLLPSLVEPGREIDLSPLRDRSVAALGLWVQGERAYRRSQFGDALALYERALAADSAMALAALGGAQAAGWQHLPSAVGLARIAVSLDSLLPERYATLARGLSAYHTGEPDTALVWLEQARALDPDWAEANAALGELFHHYLPDRPGVESLAYVYLDRAVQLDSGFTPPLYHLSEHAARQGNLARLDTLVARLERSEPDSATIRHVRAVRDCAARGPSAIRWEVLSREDPVFVLRLAEVLGVGGANIPCAEAGFRALIREYRPQASMRWHGMLGLHGVLLATNRREEATALLAGELEAGIPTVVLLQVLDALIGLPLEAEADSAVALLERLSGGAYGELQSHTLLFFGSWSARRRDDRRASAIAEALELQAALTRDQAPRVYAAAVRGHLALARGDTSAAIDRFREATSIGLSRGLTWEFAAPLVPERLALAELLLATGRAPEAASAAAVFDHPEPLLFLAGVRPSLLIRLRAAQAMGDRFLAEMVTTRLDRLQATQLLP